MRKLTDSDKQEILKLYRETAETTSTLADRYGVSNSTISRLLKSTLPEDEYEYLVSLKRAARTPEGRAQVSYDKPELFTQMEEAETEVQESAPDVAEPNFEEIQFIEPVVKVEEQPRHLDVGKSIPAIKRLRKRSSAATDAEEQSLPVEEQLERVEYKPRPLVGEQLELLKHKPPEITSIPRPLLEDVTPEAKVIAEMFGEDLLDESDDLEDLEDDEEDEDEEEYLDEEDFDTRPPLVTRPRSGEALVRVLPLSAANLPKTCYLVIDRSSELITRPLRDFGDLGQIPNVETQQKTLPVFDNHRVAKRFSTKRDRVIKVPDSKMLHKARYHLQAKGITRLLIDGQVYSLSTV